MTKCIICNNSSFKLKLTVDSFKIVKCNQCGLIYLQNPLPLEIDSNTYNKYFQKSSVNPYEENSSNIAMRTLWQLNEQRLQWIQRIKPKGSVLDIGSGRGYFLYHASQMGYKVKGFEISPLAVKYCEKHFHIKTTIQNIEKGVNLNHKYDIITLWHVLEHLSNPLKVLTNLKLLLADNGILFIEVPNINSLKFLLSSGSKKWIGGNHPRYHRFFFSARTLSRLLSTAGYKNIKRKTTTYNLSHHKKIKILLKQSLKLFDLDSFINVYAY